MMLRINWTQVRGLKDHLARQGFHPESEILVMTLYGNHITPIKTRVKFEHLQNYLFEVEGDPNLTGVFVFDAKANKPLWSAKAAEREESLETIPSNGHANVVIDFKDMNPEQKQTWFDIMNAAVQSYVDKGDA